MASNLSSELLAERRNDLLAAACRHRLAAAAAPPAALRLRLGARLVALGSRLAEDPDLRPARFESRREVDRGAHPDCRSLRTI